MSKKHFIVLADDIKRHQKHGETPFTKDQLRVLADFCRGENSRFDESLWFAYIAGECGPNGGTVKHPK